MNIKKAHNSCSDCKRYQAWDFGKNYDRDWSEKRHPDKNYQNDRYDKAYKQMMQ